MLDVHARFIRTARERAQARPRARVAAGRRGDRRAQARGRGLTRPELAIAARLQQDRPLRASCSTRRAGGSLPLGRARALLPRPAARALRRADARATGCGARSSPRRWSTTCCTAAARRSRSGCTRRPARPRRTSRAPTRVAREVFQMRPQWGEIEALDDRVAAEVQIGMLLEGRRLIERGTRWLLRNRPRPLDIAATVECFGPGAEALYDSIPATSGPRRRAAAARAEELEAAGVPAKLAMRVASLPDVLDASTSWRWPTSPASTWNRWPRCTSGSAAVSSCTGCATASSPFRATTAGARSPGRRSATTSTASTAPSPPRCCAASPRATTRTSE